LSYLLNHPKGYIHSVFSSLEMLAFPTQRVITSIDFTTGSFQFIDRSRILADISLSPDQLVDFILLCGTELLPTFPPLADTFFIRTVIDMLRHFKSGSSVVASHSEHPAVRGTGYMEGFLRTRAAVKYSLVLTAEEGTCLPLPLVIPPVHPSHAITASEVPADIHEIFSGRLPDELYFHLSKGLISPQLVGWLTSGIIHELAPLDNGESLEYRKYIENVITEGATAPRCTALALLTSCLNQAWQQKRIVSEPPIP
jgi:hypothetical protein